MSSKTNEKRFKTEREAISWLTENGFKNVRGWWINGPKSAEIQALPASKRFLVVISHSTDI